MIRRIIRNGRLRMSWPTVLSACLLCLLAYRHFSLNQPLKDSSLREKEGSIDDSRNQKASDIFDAAAIVEDNDGGKKLDDEENVHIGEINTNNDDKNAQDDNINNVKPDHKEVHIVKETNDDRNVAVEQNINTNDAGEKEKSEGKYTFQEQLSIRWPSAVNWQRTNDSIEMYMLSAFYDDRPTLGDKAAVQVLSITEEPTPGIPAKGDIYCHLWGISEKPLIVKATRILLGVENIPRPMMFHHKAFRSFIWSCELNRNTKIPMFVSVSFKTKKATTFLPVQVPLKPKVQKDFAVCQRYFGLVDPYIIIEMMELYKILGVSKVIIYITNLSPETSKVLHHYSQRGFVELVDFPTPFESHPRFPPLHKPNHIRILQPHSYNDCIYRNMYKYKYILVTDPDEIVIPLMHKTLPDMMRGIKNVPHFKDYRTFIFKNIFFFSHFPQTKTEPSKLTTLRFQNHLAPGNPFPAVQKAIVEPLSCIGFHVHHCWKRTPLAKKDVIMSEKVALSFHYRKCHFELEQEGKCKKLLQEMKHDTKMMEFKDKLLPAVVRQVNSLGLPSVD